MLIGGLYTLSLLIYVYHGYANRFMELFFTIIMVITDHVAIDTHLIIPSHVFLTRIKHVEY